MEKAMCKIAVLIIYYQITMVLMSVRQLWAIVISEIKDKFSHLRGVVSL